MPRFQRPYIPAKARRNGAVGVNGGTWNAEDECDECCPVIGFDAEVRPYFERESMYCEGGSDYNERSGQVGVEAATVADRIVASLRNDVDEGWKMCQKRQSEYKERGGKLQRVSLIEQE